MDQRNRFLSLLKANYGRWRAVARAIPAGCGGLFQELLSRSGGRRDVLRRSAMSTWSYRMALNSALMRRRAEQSRHADCGWPGLRPDTRSLPDDQWRIVRAVAAAACRAVTADKAVLLLYLDDIG